MESVNIIAEIGINHGGNFDNCLELIKSANESGADFVKLQIVDPDLSYMKNTLSYKTFKNSSLSEEELFDIVRFSKQNNISLFSTPGDFKSLELMIRLEMPIIKISSGLMSNYPLIEESIKTNLPLIISTGMSTISEIDDLVSFLIQKNAKDVSLLKCTSIYPSPPDLLNLNAIPFLQKRYPNIKIGYSDHCLDPLACVSAVALGARLIEKHFTLDKNMSGGDHFLSSEPNEFKDLVKKIRLVESMLGESKIKLTKEEKIKKLYSYRSLVSLKRIKNGEKFTKHNVGLLRPEKNKIGAPAKYYNKLLGQKSLNLIEKNQPITLKHFKHE